jgi:DNA invertase Pin-like site-specific DNA recombinase
MLSLGATSVLAVVVAGQASDGGDDPDRLPRAKRRKHRPKSDRGLPPDQELAALATQYLSLQRKLWPDLAKAGLIPEPTTDNVAQMVDDFKVRHRVGEVDAAKWHPFRKRVRQLGGNYNRFSCDGSQPTSILDQMVSCLEYARKQMVFVPWQFIFADYSVTGRDPSRQGYTSFKRVVKEESNPIATTFIYDFNRASRDEVEWWELADFMRRMRKKLLGVSDGFDLDSPEFELKISIYSLVSRLFIKSVARGALRGARGAARRGRCVWKPSLGFTRQAKRDGSGNILLRKNGKPETVPCIDPESLPHRRLMYELFLEKNWSVYKIAQHFNESRIDDWDGWTDNGIKKTLGNPDAIGVFIFNQRGKQFNLETKKFEKVRNPRSEWEVLYDPNLAIIPMDWYRRARKKLAEARQSSPITGRKRSRNQKHPSTLFSGSLICGYCGNELTLARSTTKHKSLYCSNGPTGRHGCKLSSTKATRIIEDGLLSFLRETLFTEQFLQDLIGRANAHLEIELARPIENVAPLKARAKKLETTIRQQFLRQEASNDSELCEAYARRIAELQKELNAVKLKIRDASSACGKRCEPIKPERLQQYLQDLRAVLNQEPSAAAQAIRAVMGPITITQEKNDKKVGAEWIAKFSPNLIHLLRHVAKKNDYPDSITLDHQSDGIWISPKPVTVTLGKTPKYEQFGAEYARLHDSGAKIEVIAKKFGVTVMTVQDGLRFARNGERPSRRQQVRLPKEKRKRRRDVFLYVAIREDVVRLRDDKKLTFPEIQRWFLKHRSMKVSEPTLRRAYDAAHPERVEEALKNGACVFRGKTVRYDAPTHAEIRRRLAKGETAAKIAETVGCGVMTVYRVKKRGAEA